MNKLVRIRAEDKPAAVWKGLIFEYESYCEQIDSEGNVKRNGVRWSNANIVYHPSESSYLEVREERWSNAAGPLPVPTSTLLLSPFINEPSAAFTLVD